MSVGAGLLGVLFAATAILAAVAPGDSRGRSTSGTASLTTEPSSSTPECHADQLETQLKGIQGATGNWAAAFWVADISPRACVLHSPVEVDLTDSSGRMALRATKTFAPVPLSGGASIPAGDYPPAGRLAFVVLFWPTDANAALAMGENSGRCPTADFVPTNVRMTFGTSEAVEAESLRGNDREIAICGTQVSVMDVGALSPEAAPPHPPPA